MTISNAFLCRKEFLDEVAILPQLRHPNIVQFLGAVTQQKPFMLITEYLPRVSSESVMLLNGRSTRTKGRGYSGERSPVARLVQLFANK